jgi:uncharacterized protein YidB (DUF937 family)
MDLLGMIGKMNTGNSNITQVVMDMVTQSGGMDGLVNKFKAAGFEQQVTSWLGDGPNQAINGDAIQKVLGSPMISEFANKLGMDTSALSGQIATLLPEVINAMSSGGNLTSIAGNVLSKLTQTGTGTSGIADSLKKLF